jgi:hypothetical protein
LATSTVTFLILGMSSCGLSTGGVGVPDGGTDSAERADGSGSAEASGPTDATTGSMESGVADDDRLAESAVMENDSATNPVDSAGGAADAGASSDGAVADSPLADATGIVPEACSTCLATSCAADYSACLRDPQCFDLILCTDACIKGGTTAEDCAFSCLSKSDSGSATSDAEALVGCAESNCTPCITLGSL